MRFEISILVLGSAATVLLLLAAVQGFTASAEELPLHLLLALPAVLGAALPHVWVTLYLLGTRRALAREPDAADDAREATSLGLRALAPVLGALAAIVLLVLTGARAYTGAGTPGLHGALFWALLLVQPMALWLEWRVLFRNHLLLAGHGG